MELSTLGIFHTGASLLGLACGFYALGRDREITPKNRLGQVYLLTTAFSAISALAIFKHGGFGPGHALAVLTLGALVMGTVAALTPLFKSFSRYAQAFAYSITLLFHLIPGVTEFTTRFPAGSPVFASPHDMGLRVIYLVLLLLFAVGLTLQIRWIRGPGSESVTGS